MSRPTTCLFLAAALCGVIGSRPAGAAPALRDEVSFTTFENGALMQQKGWKTLHARTGGWGSFPTSYSYRVLDVDRDPCLIDSYAHAQYHGQSSAIPIDWDGNPANGQTPLRPEPGLALAFQVSVYLQPYKPGWGCDGTGRILWSFGPGQWAGAEATGDDSKAEYDWAKGRGPRLQYRMGFDIEGKEVPQPVLRGLPAESGTPAVDGQALPAAGAWYDLRLTVTLGEDLRQARCLLQARPRGSAEWRDYGAWAHPIDIVSRGADNPATWNALLLDMPLGVWSRKGYGTPSPEMLDRYDDFVVEMVPAGAAGQPRQAKLLSFERPDAAGFVRGPKTLFAGEGATWSVQVLNSSGKELAGKLFLRRSPGAGPAIPLDPACRVPDQARRDYTKAAPGFPLLGEGDLQVVLADAAGRERVLGSAPVKVLAQKRPQPGIDLVRNASFELGDTFCGTPMRQGDEFYQRFVKHGEEMSWTQAPVEAWWVEGPSAGGVEVAAAAHSGKAGLSVRPFNGQARSVISSLNRMVNARPVTLSAWVKTAGCKGRLDLDLAGSWEQAKSREAVMRKSVALPTDSDWTRLTLTIETPDVLHALARIVVEEGTAILDDVQIEGGSTATAFNVRPEEWLRLSIGGAAEARLPQWVAGDPAPRKVTVTNDSRMPLQGQAKLFLGPWDKPAGRLLATFDVAALPPGGTKAFTFFTTALPPNAYVLCLSLEGPAALPAQWCLATDQTLGGTVSNGMLRARMAARFIIAPNKRPTQWFGVGNSMLDTNGSWFSGYGLGAYCEARPLGLTGIRTGSNEENLYLAAAVGAPIHAMAARVDFGVPEGAPFANPASPSAIDVFHPEGFAYFTRRAEEIGKEYAASPILASYQMSNESPYLNGGALCPSIHADAHFREWCRKRFRGDLKALNAAWRTAYSSWDEVEQISSARFLEDEKSKPRKEGAAAIDWTAATGTFSPQVEQRMREAPGRAMDWLRWRTETSIWMYSTFREHARKHDRKTLYGTNLCWPAFWPQMFMPFTRAMDNTQLDIQYTSGLPRALGTPYEMMDSMEMAESSDPTKPVWGIEIYVQPQWPAAYTALQNWGLLAHGMTNNLVFAWRPYSDHGAVKGTRAWEKPDAHPMWFLIDNDGTRLPHYHSCVKSLREIQAYHAHYNGLAIKRAPTPVAFYVSPDTAEYVVLETANKPWGSFWQRTRNTLIYLLRMNGVAADYVDDATLPAAPGKYRVVVVPAAYVLNQGAAARLASFARAGGTVVLAGPAGVVDPWLNKQDNLGGPAWAELAWKATEYTTDFAKVAFARGVDLSAGSVSATEKPGTMGGAIDATVAEGKTFRGAGFGKVADAAPIRDSAGAVVGWTRPWGKGKLVAYGIFPDSYATDPHPPANMTAWLQQAIRMAGLPIAGRWVSKQKAVLPGPVGSGSEVVEVVVRQKAAGEKFVFCMNQGGPGEGTVEVRVGAGSWRAEDALTGKALPGAKLSGGTWRCGMRLDAWGYRVIRLVRH